MDAMSFRNIYADTKRADSYATLEFANTYHLAFRDLPKIIRNHIVATGKPLATGDEPYQWVSETTIAPWVIYVLHKR